MVDIVGIDKISFYIPNSFLDLQDLAEKRNVEKDKYYIGIGQEKMAVLPLCEDTITMGACAGNNILTEEDKDKIGLLIFCTESGVDQSKSGGIFIHNLLGLKKQCRIIELKEACYSSTAGLRFALDYVRINPNKKVLLIASDNARYGLNTSGEPTQGCGAVAMIISQNPSIIEFDNASGYYTDDIMDFWRPNYKDEALVDGKYSTKVYLVNMLKAWEEYKAVSNRKLEDHYKICYHIPFCKMAEKAHKLLCDNEKSEINNNFETINYYNKNIGNCYTASLYVLFSCLLDKMQNLENKRIGFFAYGSGCVAEFFSGVIQKDYTKNLKTNIHDKLLTNRTRLNYYEYEDLYLKNQKINKCGDDIDIIPTSKSQFIFCGIKCNKRIYQKQF